MLSRKQQISVEQQHLNSEVYSSMFSGIKKSISELVAFEPCSKGRIGLPIDGMAEEELHVQMSTKAYSSFLTKRTSSCPNGTWGPPQAVETSTTKQMM